MKQLHGNSSRFVRELTPEERAFISKHVKSTDRNIRDGARVVDLSSEGYSVPQIMEELRRCRNYVLGWIDRFNDEGIKSLEMKKRSGRPGVYTETEEQKVITPINTRPVDSGLHFNTWDISKLQRYLNEKGDKKKNVLANSDEPDSEHLKNRIANYLHTEYPKKI